MFEKESTAVGPQKQVDWNKAHWTQNCLQDKIEANGGTSKAMIANKYFDKMKKMLEKLFLRSCI